VTDVAQPGRSPWPHAPPHHLQGLGVFMVTAGTYQKRSLFQSVGKLQVLQQELLQIAALSRWKLEAWAVFPNHYHFVAYPEPAAKTLSAFVRELHGRTAIGLNRWDRTPGRKVWHNYWESRMTYQKSYLARLCYVHQNAVRHGLVTKACHYPYCSAAWFETTAEASTVKTIYAFKTDAVRVLDDFEVNEFTF